MNPSYFGTKQSLEFFVAFVVVVCFAICVVIIKEELIVITEIKRIL